MNCDSYNEPSWLGFSPLRILSASFGTSNTAPEGWAVVSDYGGNAEINQYCGSVGGPFCVYPWFTLGNDGTFRYGANYPGTRERLRQGHTVRYHHELRQPHFGSSTLYCANQILP